LITERVTNWTLSDRRRRIDLPVGVNYSAAFDKVIQLLESVAQTHPRVLRDPAPQAFFMSFGESAIHYELRVWTDDIAQWPQIHTELAAAVYTALQGAGMHIAFPQREVRLVGGPETPKAFTQATPPGAPGGGGSSEGSAAGGGKRPAESR
jgi:small-conductance mechanosensitive channel